MMTVAAQLKIFQDVIQGYLDLQTPKGNAFICSDLVHLWKKLFDNSSALKVLIMCNGEDIRGPFGTAAILSRVDRKFLIVVSRGRSINVLDRATALVDDDGPTGKSLFQYVEDVRDLARAAVFDENWCERPSDYKGFMPFATPPGMVIDAYQIDISIGTQLGEIVPSIPDAELPSTQPS